MRSHPPLPPAKPPGCLWVVLSLLLAALAGVSCVSCVSCVSGLLPAATSSPDNRSAVPFETATGAHAGGTGALEAGVGDASGRSASPLATLAGTASARPGRASATPRPGARAASPAVGDDLPAVSLDRLPPEARETVRLIQRGGPFPYRQDGAIFQNRERLLPSKPAGYYREYTVETPGSPDRGARRLVAGSGGELYYTEDHYASFRRVVP